MLQRYYVQYMSGYDADVLNQLIQVSVFGCVFVYAYVCSHTKSDVIAVWYSAF